MKAVFDKALLTEVFTSEKSGAQYATIMSELGTFKVSSPKGGFDLDALPRIEPLKIQATFQGRVFQEGGLVLSVVDMSADLLNSKKSG